jgi:hypothetical protein
VSYERDLNGQISLALKKSGFGHAEMPTPNPEDLPESKVQEMIAGVRGYMRQERERYLPASAPLATEWKIKAQQFFPTALLNQVRIATLKGARIPTPHFYAEAKALSSGRFPDFTHMASITYIDVLVFHEEIERRPLFHSLIHATQMALLGLDRYVDLYVRGFVKSRSWLSIPLEAQAYKLDTRLAQSGSDAFSVEEEVRLWAEQGLYK